jgi:hypothetical protein
MGPSQVPVGSFASLGRVYQFKNEMFKVRKLFKIINNFLKIKEEFSVKEKISLTIILH